jgi:hypothetical protein
MKFSSPRIIGNRSHSELIAVFLDDEAGFTCASTLSSQSISLFESNDDERIAFEFFVLRVCLLLRLNTLLIGMPSYG